MTGGAEREGGGLDEDGDVNLEGFEFPRSGRALSRPLKPSELLVRDRARTLHEK